MKDIFKRQLWLGFGIIWGGVAVAAVALYFLSGSLSAHATKIVTDKALLARQTAVIGALASLKRDAAKSVTYKIAFNKLLPTHDELIGFSQWLNTIGRAHSVSPTISFRGGNIAATDAAPGSDGFFLNVTGGAADLVAFLDDLELRAPGFLLAIDSFNLANRGSDGYQLSVQGRLFSR